MSTAANPSKNSVKSGKRFNPLSWLKTYSATTSNYPESFWISLNYFNIYRLIVASLFFFAILFYRDTLNFNIFDLKLFKITIILYLVLSSVFHIILKRFHVWFSLQLGLHMAVDIVVIMILIYASGGLNSGLGIMLLISLAASALVSDGKLALFYAAIASIAVLIQQSAWVLLHNHPANTYVQAGLLSIGYFVTTAIIHQLAKRVIANQELAQKRGLELANQLRINQLIIQDMQDGVLVVDNQNEIRLYNPQAEKLLDFLPSHPKKLEDLFPQLAKRLHDWLVNDVGLNELISIHGKNKLIRPRFVRPSQNKSDDTVIFLEDISKLQEQAKQMKLAALGRLTANIAHEIRNPLSAISHASELLSEENSTITQTRLCNIIAENTQRLERMVKDVLELNRRDHLYLEQIELNKFLPNFIEEFTEIEKIPLECFDLLIESSIKIRFDRNHLHQVLWNLVRNAWRHGLKKSKSIKLGAKVSVVKDKIEIDIINDGPGVPKDLQNQLFEPFFTTHKSGAGLGLYIGRELCDANQATLEYLDDTAGAHFRIICIREVN